MLLSLTAICLVVVLLSMPAVLWMKRKRERREMEEHSITAEELHSVLASKQDVDLFDVRQPLDLLAYPEVIPGARRIAPKELLETPSLLSKETQAIVYSGEKTSRAILHRALAMHFSRVKFLKGGLAAWKAKGYLVEPYREVFHLYNPILAPH